MYSPKIREALIPRIYWAAKAAGISMTRWVNQVIEAALAARDREEVRMDQATSLDPSPNPHQPPPKGGPHP